jgi:hypothetical protein
MPGEWGWLHVRFQQRHAAPKVGSISKLSPSNPPFMTMSIDWDNIQMASSCNSRRQDTFRDARVRFCDEYQ